jgi:hypothetical protein
MAKRGMRKYLGIVFMAVIIVPAVVLSLLAIRAISHEEAYVERQLAGTLSADVTHMASLVAAELAGMHSELTATSVVPRAGDLSGAFEEWKRSSALVEVPFLLSAEHEILWPAMPSTGAKKGDNKEASFAAEQKDFFSDMEDIPVYENIAVAFQDEILDEVTEAEETVVETVMAPARAKGRVDSDRASVGAKHPIDTGRADVGSAESEPPALARGATEAATGAPPGARGEQSRKQTAITEFQQSEEVRQRVFDKAELDGQEVLYRNVNLAEGGGGEAADAAGTAPVDDASSEAAPRPAAVSAKKMEKLAESPAEGEADAAGRIRSIFVSQPLSFSEIVADRSSGIIPRTIDGRLRHIYWQRLEDGNILGCLVDAEGFRERIIGALTNIYSPVRILTVLDERGSPLIIPQGQDGRDWREPFVAMEISELLPRWESAAYISYSVGLW